MFPSAHFLLDACSPDSKGKQFFSSSDSEDDEDSRKKFKIKIKPLVSDSAKCVPPSMDELKASVGGLALSPSLVRTADQYSHSFDTSFHVLIIAVELSDSVFVFPLHSCAAMPQKRSPVSRSIARTSLTPPAATAWHDIS